jgi:hypothetical protein
MIKIEIDNIEAVKNEFFDGVVQLITPRLNFYLTAFKVIDRQAGFNRQSIENFAGMIAVTKTAFLKVLGRNRTSFRTMANWSRLRNPNFLSIHFYNERANYIALLTSLLNPAALRSLILAGVDDMQNQEVLYDSSWLTPEGHKLIKEIICYDVFIKKETLPYNAYHLASKLHVNVCPYCNRVYTNTIIGTGNNLIIRPTFDHYFHQAIHPFLALSFYNLVPSCNYCNSNLKGQKQFTLEHHIHPYKEGFVMDATFDYLQIAFHAQKSDPRNYKIRINENITSANTKHVRIFGDAAIPDSGNVEVFKLREVYQGHSDVVGELVVKSDKLSPYYAGSVMKLLAQLGSSKMEFYRFYFSNYYEEKDFNNRPLAKLTKDIITKYLPEILE